MNNPDALTEGTAASRQEWGYPEGLLLRIGLPRGFMGAPSVHTYTS